MSKIKSDKLARFTTLITINSAEVSPADADVYSDTSKLQAKLNNDRSSSRVLGMDFLMFAEQGLFTRLTDLNKATGIFNYAQAITHRLSTTRGTMPGDSFFGVPWNNYLGKTYKNKSIVLANLREDILEEIEKDPRTGSVPSINLNFLSPTSIQVDITLIPILTNLNNSVNILLTSED